MSDNLDAVGGRKSIEFLPENISIGRELLPGDAISQIGEKTGFGDQRIKDMFPALKNFHGHVHFEKHQRQSIQNYRRFLSLVP